ncbi:MAG: DUF2865 domain-containing protein [Hyphomicrobiales bacterium]
MVLSLISSNSKFWLTKRLPNIKPWLGVTGLAGAITVSISLFGNVDDAHADINACRALKTELASLRSRSVTAASGGSSSQSNRFANLAKRQQRALRSAERDAVSLRCVTRSGKRTGNGAASCPALISKIKKMRRNLNKLVKKRDSASGGSSRGLSRGDIRAKKRFLKKKISRLRCNQIERQARRDISEQKRSERRKKKGNSLLARLFGRQSRYAEPEIQEQEQEQSQARVVGTVFRTLCVRISDGYYFPLSFATVRSNFDTDEAKCKASNPNEELRLFVHRNPSQEPEEMVDLAGLAYTKLPNAFLYRTKFVAPRRFANGNGLTVVAGVTPGQLTQANDPRFGTFPNLFGNTGKIIEKPAAKPTFFSDPDTAFSIAGNFTLKPVNKIEKPKNDKIASASKKLQTTDGETIRVIGPKFLDAQQSVKLLLAPDQIQVQ